MDDEIQTFSDGRPAAPPYRSEAREKAREELLRAARGQSGFRLPRLGWHAVAAFGVTVTLVGGVAVALSGAGEGGTDPASSVAVSGELEPRPGQFVLVESQTMYSVTEVSQSSESRYLSTTKRKIWQSADGSADGLLSIETLAPKPWPGQNAVASIAKKEEGTEWFQLRACPSVLGNHLSYYSNLAKLPADQAGMRERLYADGGGDDGKDGKPDKDARAFTATGDLLRETYLPKAQRDALFEAARTIPGVEVAEQVQDGAGRTGVALGRVAAAQGVLEQLIFDPATHAFMGERHTVVDAATARAPKDSVIALTAELKTSVVDELPKVDGRVQPDSSCEQPQPETTASPVDEPTDMPASIAPTPMDAPADEPVTTDGPVDLKATLTPTDEATSVKSIEPTAEPPSPGGE